LKKFNDKTNSPHGNAIQREQVAKTIFEAISTERPEFRMLVGKDAVSLLDAINNIPYSEFQKMIMQNIME